MSDDREIARPDDEDAKVRAAAAVASADAEAAVVHAEGVDDEPAVGNQRLFTGPLFITIAAIAACYAAFHILSLNISALILETWNYRIVHIAGALGLGFLIYSGARFSDGDGGETVWSRYAAYALALPALFALGVSLYYASVIFPVEGSDLEVARTVRALVEDEVALFGLPLWVATGGAILLSWMHRSPRGTINVVDIVLVICAIAVASYLITIYDKPGIRQATGSPFAVPGMAYAAVAGTALILEVTRRVAGLALVIIAAIFLGYTFTGPFLPGILNYPGLDWLRFFSQLYTDAGILGPTTAVSSTYIILFIIFAAFLQASKVGDYFVNFAFATAGRSRGGPAKVAIFASGLMGMINGTSAGNVVATGSLTIPLMKRVGYPSKSSGAIEAAASTGGQIMPPIMGAGAFIMAEITGIPYLDITVAAIIPAILYFASILFMVDLQAVRLGMRGMRSDELPVLSKLLAQIYLFIPIIILIYALFSGYSVIRAGALATASAAMVSWLTPHAMGPRGIAKAFQLAGVMSIQIIAVCACAGIIVGVISLTGIGARFSSLLLDLAENSKLLALFFAMCISILLGMGMPTTAAYAVAASVVAPGLVNELGIPALTAHFFVFYFAVLSAITPPVALASYAAAGISGANPMGTSVASFKIGLAAFIVPFMFFYNSAILMEAPFLALDADMVTIAGNTMMRIAEGVRIAPDDLQLLVGGAAVAMPALADTAFITGDSIRQIADAVGAAPNAMEFVYTGSYVELAPFVEDDVLPRVATAFGVTPEAAYTDWFALIQATLTALVGVYLLSAAVEGYFLGGRLSFLPRLMVLAAAIMMIEGGLLTDAIGLALTICGVALQRLVIGQDGRGEPGDRGSPQGAQS